MRKSIVILLLTLFSGDSLQARKHKTLDKVVAKFISTLRHNKVDTIIIYQLNSGYWSHTICKDINNKVVNTGSSSKAYILWRKNGKSFVTKRDFCSDYPTLTTNVDSVWLLSIPIADSLKNERHIRLQGTKKIEGEVTITSTPGFIDDAGFQTITITMRHFKLSANVQGDLAEITPSPDGNSYSNYMLRIDHVLYSMTRELWKNNQIGEQMRK